MSVPVIESAVELLALITPDSLSSILLFTLHITYSFRVLALC